MKNMKGLQDKGGEKMKWTKEMIKTRNNGITKEQFAILKGTLALMKKDYFSNMDYSETLSTPYDRQQAKERAERAEIMYRGALQAAYSICNMAQWEDLVDATSWI